MDEEGRRLRDSLAFRNQDMKEFSHTIVKPKFVVNTNNKLINAIHAVDHIDPELAKQMAFEVYDLARLSQKEMEEQALSTFITRSASVLEELAIRLTGK